MSDDTRLPIPSATVRALANAVRANAELTRMMRAFCARPDIRAAIERGGATPGATPLDATFLQSVEDGAIAAIVQMNAVIALIDTFEQKHREHCALLKAPTMGTH